MNKVRKKIGIFACVAILAISWLAPSLALATDNEFYEANDIVFYDPNATGCTGGVSSPTNTNNSQNLNAILTFLVGKKLSLAAAAGIAGNLMIDTNKTLSPTYIEGDKTAKDEKDMVEGTGFGIGQWASKDRQQGLKDQAKTAGKSVIDLSVQLDYLWKDASTYTEMMGMLQKVESGSPYKGIDASLAAAIIFHGDTDIIDKAKDKIVEAVGPPAEGFEGTATTAQDLVANRGGEAMSIYSANSGKIAAGSSPTPATPATPSGDAGPVDCSQLSGAATKAGKIVETALTYAWHYEMEPTDLTKIFSPGSIGADSAYMKSFATPAYQAARPSRYADCAAFVGAVMRTLRFDPGWPFSGITAKVYDRVQVAQYWNSGTFSSEKDLRPGDILIGVAASDHMGHTSIYIGPTKGSDGKKYIIAEAWYSKDRDAYKVPNLRGVGGLKTMIDKELHLYGRIKE